jgi:hypothetical protein
MRRDIALLSFALWPLVVATPARAELDIIEAPIVDGRRASASELHGTVSLTDAAGESGCTGTLIAPRVVVTAAHCVTIEDEETEAVTGLISLDDIFVVAGALEVASAGDDDVYGVERMVIHPGYPNEPPTSNSAGAGRYDDVAILILERAVTGLSVATIPSVDDAMGALDGATDVVISGYGTTGPDRDDSGVLYIAETRFDGRFDAEIVLGGNGTPDTCPGDSGGPAYIVGSGRLWLVGITSRAAEDSVATCGERGVYAFAPVYRDWLVTASEGLYAGADAPAPGPDPDDGGDDGEEDDFDDEGCAAGGFGQKAPIAGAVVFLGVVAFASRRRRALAG